MTDLETVRAYYTATLPWYDAALEDRGDLSFWRTLSKRWSARNILELGCGTGRVTSIVSASTPTTAVDLLIELLTRARTTSPRAQLVVSDLRTFAFVSPFDLVILADDPMAHLTSLRERADVLRRIASHLSPDGRVVLEGLYRTPGRALIIPPRDVVRDGATPFVVGESWIPAADAAIWKATYRYTANSVTTQAETTLRSWTLDEIARLPEAGLQVDDLWGDFDERPFSPAAPRIIIVARRHD